MRHLLAILLFAVLAAPGAAADAVPGDAARFAGHWAVAFPDGEGVIVNKPDATCAAPVVIAVSHDHFISYTGPGGEPVEFEVMSFGGRNPWWSADGRSMIAEWKDDDRFWLAATDMGKADWTRAKEFKRCPD